MYIIKRGWGAGEARPRKGYNGVGGGSMDMEIPYIKSLPSG